MRCIEISRPGGPEVLQPAERPLPSLGATDVLLRVAFAGVNRPDVLQRSGAYPPPAEASDLPGLEVSGTVVATGDAVPAGLMGSPVMALVPGGGYAEYVRVRHDHAIAKPDRLSMAEAAAMPETLFTVWHNLVRLGQLAEGQKVLIHGGSSGIGTMAIQVCRLLGARPIATAGSAAKCMAIEALGAEAINYRETDFVEEIRSLTQGRGADVIVDMVGGDYVARNYRAAAVGARIVQIATLNGAEATANVGMLMAKRLTHTGSTLRPRSDEFKANLARELETHVVPAIERGAIRPIMDEIVPLDRAADAHRRMERGDHIGKIVLKAHGD